MPEMQCWIDHVHCEPFYVGPSSVDPSLTQDVDQDHPDSMHDDVDVDDTADDDTPSPQPRPTRTSTLSPYTNKRCVSTSSSSPQVLGLKSHHSSSHIGYMVVTPTIHHISSPKSALDRRPSTLPLQTPFLIQLQPSASAAVVNPSAFTRVDAPTSSTPPPSYAYSSLDQAIYFVHNDPPSLEDMVLFHGLISHIHSLLHTSSTIPTNQGPSSSDDRQLVNSFCSLSY
ncbi:hypothetical protein L2E82_39802 [Cichorium intybus]|uniref:Uncharacterized protein n=1 Tax=Cichorium intybus TaxID=13427 RepID=A0ACB9AJ05_CICIN|nr:hypothetical protein L2E82_39802 [Cichorium intybus]